MVEDRTGGGLGTGCGAWRKNRGSAGRNPAGESEGNAPAGPRGQGQKTLGRAQGPWGGTGNPEAGLGAWRWAAGRWGPGPGSPGGLGTRGGPAAAGSPTEDRAFRVRIAGAAPLQGVLGGALTIPCHVHYLRPPLSRRAVLGSPRVKWTFLSGGREAEVLVARGLRVKVSEAYRFRVALPAYPASLTDVSLALSELRPNDSGIYRCEVQHGIDDSSDAVEVKVKGETAGTEFPREREARTPALREPEGKASTPGRHRPSGRGGDRESLRQPRAQGRRAPGV